MTCSTGDTHVCALSVGRSDSTGKVVHRGLNFTHRHTSLYQPVNDLQHFLINPHLPARGTHFRRHMLEQVNMRASLHLMGDRGGFELAATDSTAVDCLFWLSWSSSPPLPRIFPLARVEPMDGNDIETVMGLVIAHRDIQGLVVFLHPHEQTLRKRFGSRPLLNDFPLGQHPYGMRAGNAAFLCPQQRMVAPRNASSAGGGSYNSDSKRHVSYIG